MRGKKKKKLKRIAMEMMDFDNYFHEQNEWNHN